MVQMSYKKVALAELLLQTTTKAETPTGGCLSSPAHTSDVLATIPANWAGCSEETLGYQLPFKRIAGIAVAQHRGNIHIGAIQGEIRAQDRSHVMDTRFVSTLGRVDSSSMISMHSYLSFYSI